MIIKYTVENNQTPSYVTSGGYFPNHSTGERIGIGTKFLNRITQEELRTYVLALHNSKPLSRFDSTAIETSSIKSMTEAEVITMVNEWYIENVNK